MLALFIVGSLVFFGLKIINPSKYLDKTRDGQRADDIMHLQTAVDLYIADGKSFNNLISHKTYESFQANEKTDGSGWLPLNFDSVSSGVPLSSLPTDPLGQKYYYRFGVDLVNSTYEIDCRFESAEFREKTKEDGGNNPDWLEIGSDLSILN
jgi:hypothetical protein